MLEKRQQMACFGGSLEFYAHASSACNSEMRFSIFLPPQAGSRPVVVWLAGLTCTEENFMAKAGAQRVAAELGLILVAPDTSPRNLGIPGETDSWDFGAGAGFYVDATEDPWRTNYQMYSYVTQELPALLGSTFPVNLGRQSIMGHSMGGHGALVCALRNPQQYQAVSAFAPIAAPMQCPWGQKALGGYLGSDPSTWAAYDASQLVATSAWDRPILIDQGEADPFLSKGQLLPDVLAAACQAANKNLTLRYHPGYDHSYYFIATFIEQHLRHHADPTLPIAHL